MHDMHLLTTASLRSDQDALTRNQQINYRGIPTTWRQNIHIRTHTKHNTTTIPVKISYNPPSSLFFQIYETMGKRNGCPLSKRSEVVPGDMALRQTNAWKGNLLIETVELCRVLRLLKTGEDSSWWSAVVVHIDHTGTMARTTVPLKTLTQLLPVEDQEEEPPYPGWSLWEFQDVNNARDHIDDHPLGGHLEDTDDGEELPAKLLSTGEYDVISIPGEDRSTSNAGKKRDLTGDTEIGDPFAADEVLNLIDSTKEETGPALDDPPPPGVRKHIITRRELAARYPPTKDYNRNSIPRRTRASPDHTTGTKVHVPYILEDTIRLVAPNALNKDGVSLATGDAPTDIHIPGYGLWRRDIYTKHATTGKPTTDQSSITREHNAHDAVEDIRPSLSKKESQGTSGPNSRHYAELFEDKLNIFIPGSDFRALPTSARDQKDVHSKARGDRPKIVTGQTQTSMGRHAAHMHCL